MRRRRRAASGRSWSPWLVLVVGRGRGGVVWWRGGDETRLARAVALAPAGTERLSWTDWAAVRRAGRRRPRRDAPRPREVAAFLDAASTPT